MDRLRFGARARRKARGRRYRTWAAVVSLAALLIGIPGSDAGIRLLSSLTGGDEEPVRIVAATGYETSETAAGLLTFRSRVFKNRPTPSPSPTEGAEAAEPAEEAVQQPAYSGSVTEIIHAAAAEFGLSGDYLVAVAHCESTLNPGAVNPAGYHGLFQFDQQTWGAYGYGSIYDPVAQARTAARLIAGGQAGRWPSCA